ncbi:hypothetical protein G9F71_004160 [Clostridium sp. FP2]|uniref:hypothetical protein n=1 Tax=Clostridium sp. FP2 TaxID=2724481 RepID=UPI0013E98D86|nr:hypothetical protein [Clostridium sp. FP2]MBZ9622052.1 hypothetical protein [Clostridium sp. FP2]
MNEEELLYNVIFPQDEDPNYINYGYFIGRNKKSIYKLKATINEGPLNPILICDGNNENAFFAKVFQNEVDRFLKIVNDFNFKQININKNYMNEVKQMFGEEVIEHQKKVYKAHRYQYPQKFTNGIKNWEIPYIKAVDPIKEHKPTLKRAI